MLKYILIDTNFIFIKHDGNVMHPDTVTKFLNEFLKKHKLKHSSIHNLRHIHCSILVDSGMSYKKIADQLGHADLQMLMTRYTHNMTKNTKETAERMKKYLIDREEVIKEDDLEE